MSRCRAVHDDHAVKQAAAILIAMLEDLNAEKHLAVCTVDNSLSFYVCSWGTQANISLDTDAAQL